MVALLNPLAEARLCLQADKRPKKEKSEKKRMRWARPRESTARGSATVLMLLPKLVVCRGRSKLAKKLARRQKNVVDEKQQQLKQKLEQAKEERSQRQKEQDKSLASSQAPRALQRFC